jgi:hypothetical protein
MLGPGKSTAVLPAILPPPRLHFRKTAVCHHDRRRQLWLYPLC